MWLLGFHISSLSLIFAILIILCPDIGPFGLIWFGLCPS